MHNTFKIKVFVSALASKSIIESPDFIQILSNYPDSLLAAKAISSSQMIRALKIAKKSEQLKELPELKQINQQVFLEEVSIGRKLILFKSPLPGELQARLAIESATDRFVEYLQKIYHIAVLDDSDYHIQVFIPSNSTLKDFKVVWEDFIGEVIFSEYGKYQLPGLAQTFIVMLNAVTLSARGFSTLDLPILTMAQARIMAALYRAVIRDVNGRQAKRQSEINQLQVTVLENTLTEKEYKSKQKELSEKMTMQDKEFKKYSEFFQKSFIDKLYEQESIWQEIELLRERILKLDQSKSDKGKLQKQEEKLSEKIIWSRTSIQQKISIIEDSGNNPFRFVELDEKAFPEKFSSVNILAKIFTKTATDQINSTRGDIFTQCISEMYRLLEMPVADFEALPLPLLTEEPILPRVRSPGDDSKDFCYSCGVAMEAKKARWQVLRFMFERPSQRRQSSSGEGRPYICASCAALAFASPLKVTDESIIIKLEAKNDEIDSKARIKDYIRMLTNKEMHLSAGRYLILASEKTGGGDLASQKLGQVQYALAKIASIFPIEVLSNFRFSLITQGSQLHLQGRHLIFLKGLIDCYRQFILISGKSGKDINMPLGDAIRYIQQDLPFLADYRLTTESSYSNNLSLEQVRGLYWKAFINDLGDNMELNTQTSKRARLYRDVSALTGLTYAFAQSLESTAKKLMKQDDAEREVSKLIEEVDDPIAFGYYATLGDEKKTSVQARLYHAPENDFIYSQTKWLLEKLCISNRENKDDKGNHYLQLYVDDVSRAYQYFASKEYMQEKDWKDLTYNLKLSLYTRFPELVRKIKSTSEKN